MKRAAIITAILLISCGRIADKQPQRIEIKNKNMRDEMIEVILLNEGGYVNNPNDPGGETKYGISKKYYPHLDIPNLTKKQAVEIYRNDYYVKMNIDLIADDSLKLQVFDMGVNAGPKTAIKLLQKVVNVKKDGVFGPITAEAVNQRDILHLYKVARIEHYTTLIKHNPKLMRFFKGWINRIEHTKI